MTRHQIQVMEFQTEVVMTNKMDHMVMVPQVLDIMILLQIRGMEYQMDQDGIKFKKNAISKERKSMNKIGIVVACMLVISASFFSGCVTTEKGMLTLKITDAPGELNISKALVTISYVEVHIASGGNNSSAEWITVINESQQFDLIQLENITDFLGNTTLDVGIYTQIRLHIAEALVTIDGEQYDLEIPSKTVKLVNQFIIEPGMTTTLILDFDIKDSVHKTGSNKYILQPTIRVIEE